MTAFIAKRLTSYSSHSGTTSKMWILPDGKGVSISSQHFEWALAQAKPLRAGYEVNLRNVRSKGDTAIRLYLLRRGFVRVNYEHKGGKLTVEAHHLRWGVAQIKGLRKVMRANLPDLSFVVIRLLNDRAGIKHEEFVNVIGCSITAAFKKFWLCRIPASD